jgi:hypothetical protein
MSLSLHPALRMRAPPEPPPPDEDEADRLRAEIARIDQHLAHLREIERLIQSKVSVPRKPE